MIAKLVMTALLGGVALYAWMAIARVRVIGTLFMALTLAGLYFVWFQDQATNLAHLAGIGRGVDLFIYGWIVFSLLAILNLHLFIRLQDERITRLVRHLAILEAKGFEARDLEAVGHVARDGDGAGIGRADDKDA